jgi:hypothetical protein
MGDTVAIGVDVLDFPLGAGIVGLLIALSQFD